MKRALIIAWIVFMLAVFAFAMLASFDPGVESSRKVCNSLLTALKDERDPGTFLQQPNRKKSIAILKSQWQALNSTKLGKVLRWDTGGGAISYNNPKTIELKYILYGQNGDRIGDVRFNLIPLDKNEMFWRVHDAEWRAY